MLEETRSAGSLAPQQAVADDGRVLRQRAQGLRLAEMEVEALVVRRLVHCSASLVCCLSAAARYISGVLLAVATAVASQGDGLVSVRRRLAVANGGLSTSSWNMAKASASRSLSDLSPTAARLSKAARF